MKAFNKSCVSVILVFVLFQREEKYKNNNNTVCCRVI